MKRLFALLFCLLIMTGALGAQETLPAISLGTQFGVDYAFVSAELDIWNLRYGVVLDLLFKIDSVFFVGIEGGAIFGFHKANITDPGIDGLNLGFPVHATVSIVGAGLTAQVYGGMVALADAYSANGVFRESDFSFLFLPDIGAKIGFGDLTNIFIKAGYIFSEPGLFYCGIGARLGL